MDFDYNLIDSKKTFIEFEDKCFESQESFSIFAI